MLGNPLTPAVEDCETRVYFIKESGIVGEGRIATRYQGHVTIEPDEATSNGLFANDYAKAVTGRVDNLRYNAQHGWPEQGFSDEPEDRHLDTMVVGKMLFDYGIGCDVFNHIEGWGQKLVLEEDEV
jgi:hypothetical protein